MKYFTTTIVALTCALCANPNVSGQEMPEMPVPAAEHEWLQRFAGEWESDVRIFMDPEAPPMQVTATESFRSVGGFWLVGDIRGQMEGMPPFEGVYTIGYNPEEGKYVGTWVESTTSILRTYEGSVDPDGRTLTMETEGPCPMRPGEHVRMRDVTEFRNDDHRVVTSSLLIDGEWITTVRIDSRRKSNVR